MLVSSFRVALLVTVAAMAAACSTTDEADDDEALASSLETPDDPIALDAFEGRALWIDTYASFPDACVDRRDPIDGARAIFGGCYDWHSSVHAHWAVLRADLVGGEDHRERAPHVDGRLTDAAVDAVADELAREPTFEMPYGRAWLLRLATEHVKWRAARGGTMPARMRALADTTARSLVDGFAGRSPDPQRADYRSDAWTLAQLHHYAVTVNDAALRDATRELVERGFAAHPVRWQDTNDRDPSSFFSAFWSWAYVIAQTRDAESALALVRPELLPDDALTPLPDPNVRSEVHHLGINWSRAWAIKALARHATTALGASHPTTLRLATAYHAHVRAGRERHLRYRGDYYAYDHWVPQFAIYAITD